MNAQINDCRRILNFPTDSLSVNLLTAATNTFESLLSHKIDETYKNQLSALNAKNHEILKKMEKNEQRARRLDLSKEYCRKKFELLIALAIRRQIMVTEDIEETL